MHPHDRKTLGVLYLIVGVCTGVVFESLWVAGLTIVPLFVLIELWIRLVSIDETLIKMRRELEQKTKNPN